MNKPRSNSVPPLFLILWVIVGSVLGAHQTRAQSQDGLFAVFTTNAGMFTCELYFKRTPRTVANFVSLAEGTRPWADFKQAKVSQAPYYDGNTFHRVVKDFVIQAGSPNGTGTDGPGYRFRDELHADLKHDRAGILSMAKTSQPHTNGSQFFVTLAETPWLDNVHSVFGAVVEGQSVVNTIGQTPTDGNSRPTTPQIIQSIRIVRNGTEAQNFDVHKVTPPLPVIRSVPSQITRTDIGLDLIWEAKENHEYHAFFSEDLKTWRFQTLAPVGRADLEIFLKDFSTQFYHFIEAGRD